MEDAGVPDRMQFLNATKPYPAADQLSPTMKTINAGIDADESSHYHEILLTPVIFHIVEFCLLILLITGNATVIWIIKFNETLRNKANAFVTVLAISDLCFGICTTIVLTLSTYLYSNAFGCRLIGVINTFFPSVSNITLCFVSIDRLIFVRKPAQYQETSRFSRNAIILTYIVAHSLCFATLPPLWGWGQYTQYEQMNTCLLDLSGSPKFGYIAVIYGYLTPFLIVVGSSIRIYREARLQCNQIRSASFVERQSVRRVLRDTKHGFRRTSKTLSLMIIVHFVCLTPFIVVQVTSFYHAFNPGVALYASWLLNLANSSIEPWVYGMYNPAFRKCIRRCKTIFHCKKIKKRRLFQQRFRAYQVSPYI